MTREELQAAVDSVTVVDAQPPARYGQRHLPDALNLVAEDSDEHVTGALAMAGASIVVYSTDPAPRGARTLDTGRGDRRARAGGDARRPS
jgi:hypothetical protein